MHYGRQRRQGGLALSWRSVEFVSTFIGGISNAGTISAGAIEGIGIYTVSEFSSGIVNTGAISAFDTAVEVDGASTFSGGIVNRGTLSHRIPRH